MTKKTGCLIVAIALATIATGVHAEVRVGNAQGTQIVFTPVANGTGGMDPWPHVSSGVPEAWILNADGDTNSPADGWPAPALDSTNNRFEVAWAQHDGNDYEIVTSYWDGSGWTTPFAATVTSADCENPSLAFLSDGTAHIQFTMNGGTYYVQRPNGGSWSSPQLVGS